MAREDVIDQPGRVRDEDRIDGAAVTQFSNDRVGEFGGEPAIGQFLGSASNLTHLLRYGERELILRRPPLAPRRGARETVSARPGSWRR